MPQQPMPKPVHLATMTAASAQQLAKLFARAQHCRALCAAVQHGAGIHRKRAGLYAKLAARADYHWHKTQHMRYKNNWASCRPHAALVAWSAAVFGGCWTG